MSKLEKRLRAEYETYEFHVSYQSFLQHKYETALDKKQFALADQINALIGTEITS